MQMSLMKVREGEEPAGRVRARWGECQGQDEGVKEAAGGGRCAPVVGSSGRAHRGRPSRAQACKLRGSCAGHREGI